MQPTEVPHPSLCLPPLTRVAQPDGALLVADAHREAGVDGSWFAFAGPGAMGPGVPVAGGRGGARLVDTPAGRALLRHYRRGGLVARFNADRYWWTGEDAVRSFAELRVLAALHAAGLPVPAPIAARYRRSGPWYRAAILVGEIADAETLARRLLRDPDGIDWTGLGRTIARFHRAGVEHVDLNAHNVLFAAGVVHLVDFDRARVRGPAAAGDAWPARVLARLDRSLRKLDAARHVADYAARCAALVAAHDAALAGGPGSP